MVFLMDKAIYAIVFMYAVSFSMFGAQYMIGDVLGITILGPNGQPIKSNLLSITNTNEFNNISVNGTSALRPTNSAAALTSAVQAGFELFQLLTGTYMFNLLLFFGVPAIAIYPITGVFSILAIRAMIGMIKEFI